MNIIGITKENYVFREHERIVSMIRSGKVIYFHIRKPNFSLSEMRAYLEAFPMDIREKLSLHSFHFLAKEMNIGGVHLNKANPTLDPSLEGKRVSMSCHSIEEVQENKDKVSYCFLSPIFDSISKRGYTSAFDSCSLGRLFAMKVLDNKVVALGGVTWDRINILSQIGFSSVAMLSSIWSLPKTMFISHCNDKYDYFTSCRRALEGGVRFIQLRMKGSSDEEVLNVAKPLRKLCDDYAALLTIDDRIHLLKTFLFDGVHLGKNDMPIREAKQITMDKYLLGATCNTKEDALNAIESGADYIGMGPYRYTTTKKHLSSILGIEGYKNVLNDDVIKKNKPLIYAIGGIGIDDLKEIKSIGIYGVALSSVIMESDDTKNTIQNILRFF